jgi:hypothetical protein
MSPDPPLQEGDLVEILPGAPLPPGRVRRSPQTGRIVLVDRAEPDTYVIQLGTLGRVVSLPGRWLRRIGHAASR